MPFQVSLRGGWPHSEQLIMLRLLKSQIRLRRPIYGAIVIRVPGILNDWTILNLHAQEHPTIVQYPTTNNSSTKSYYECTKCWSRMIVLCHTSLLANHALPLPPPQKKKQKKGEEKSGAGRGTELNYTRLDFIGMISEIQFRGYPGVNSHKAPLSDLFRSFHDSPK